MRMNRPNLMLSLRTQGIYGESRENCEKRLDRGVYSETIIISNTVFQLKKKYFRTKTSRQMEAHDIIPQNQLARESSNK